MDPTSRDPSSAPAVVDAEIESALRDALRNFGLPGRVTVRGKHVELSTGGAPISIELELLQEQWPLLPPEMRQRKIGEVARRVVAAYRASTGASTKGDADAGRGPKLPPRPVMITTGSVLAIALVALVIYRSFPNLFRGDGDAKPDAGVATETEEQAAARRARVCDAARARLYSGAPTIGALDTEGWYVELWLARSKGEGDLRQHEAIRSLVQDGHVAPAADPFLAERRDGKVEIVAGFTAEEAAKAGTWQSVTIRFGGRYVEAFLDPADRTRFIALGDRLAETIPAEMGALYARCAHLPNKHDLGAWFRGLDVPSTAAALVYQMGFFSEVPAVSRASVAAAGGGFELDALRSAAAKLDSMGLASLVGADGGSITTHGGGAISLSFPSAGGTRASRASRVVANKLGVGVD